MCDPLLELAARQHGVVARRQGRDLGMSDDRVRDLLDTRHWEEVTDEVLRRTGSHAGRAQRAMSAVLDAGPGAVLARRPAAAWWRVPGPQLEPLHVVRASRSHRRSSICEVHVVRHLPARWTTVLDGIPIARPELLALHLFATEPSQRAETWVERMWSMRLLDARSLDRFLRDHGRRGRNGTAGVRRYVEVRGLDYTPVASNLESRAQQVLRDAGIAVDRQVDAGDGANWTGRVDFRVVGLPVLIEVQSEFHHSALVDRRSDELRIDALRRAGFHVVQATDVEVFHRPQVMIARVRDAIAAATA